MTWCKRVALAGCVLSLSFGLADAEDQIGGVPCNEFCQSWLGSSVAQPDQGGTIGQTFTFKLGSRGASMLNDYYSVRADCRSQGRVDVTLVQAPTSGQVLTDRSKMFPAFSAEDDRAQCNLRKVPVTRVFYKPVGNVADQDAFVIAVRFPNGEVIQERYVVTAR